MRRFWFYGDDPVACCYTRVLVSQEYLCRFWFYGDDPVETRLQKMAEYLDAFEARTDVESLVPVQPLFDAPKKVVGYYAAGEQQVRSLSYLQFAKL